MSEKLKNFLKKHKNELNQIKLENPNNNINYDYNTEENNNFITLENNLTEDAEFTTENKLKNDINNKEINNNNIESNIENEEEEEEEEQNEDDEEKIPLITLNFISICQCCKNRFDKEKYIPYLFKCGHFFCLNCIQQYFTDETGIVCPTDGLVANSVQELKLLKNLIINPNKTKNIKKNNIKEKSDYYNYMKDNLKKFNLINNSERNKNYCRIHKNQKLSHIICDTNEIICVHCAFEMLKLNPSIKIQEIKEKYNDLNNVIQNIINNNQKNIDLIYNSIELIKKNKEYEQKKLNLFYNNIIKYLENEKKENMKKIEKIYNENIYNLEQKSLIFNEIIEQGDYFQNTLEKESDDINQNFINVLNNYNNIIKLNQSNNVDNFNNKLKYIKFINKNEINIKEYLNKISSINIINKIILYNKKVPSKENENKLKKQYQNNTHTGSSSSRYQKRIVKNNFLLKNKKNISLENLYQNYSSERNTFNSSVKIKSPIYIQKNFEDKIKEMNKKLKSGSKTPIIKEENKIKHKKNRLLNTYFDMKNDKNNNINEEDNSEYFNYIESAKSQHNNKSFNHLNILNNFYNLDYSRRSPKNKDFDKNDKKDVFDMEQIKLYNESLNKLIPKQLNKFNFE